MSTAPDLVAQSADRDPALPRYVYEPLDSGEAEIRILTVKFDAKHVLRRINAPPLVGNLEKYYLPISSLSRTQRMIRSAQLPPFFALSYVWGDPSRNHEIIINGKRLGITENLYRALLELQPSTLGYIGIWADAICICQDDDAERSAQVLLMREIYHAAADVKIWLGPSNEDSIRCLKFISNLSENYWVSDADNSRAFPTEPTIDNKFEENLMNALMIPSGVLLRGAYSIGQSITETFDIISPVNRDEKVKMISDEDADLSLHEDIIEAFVKWKPPSRRLKKVEHENFGEIAEMIDRVFIQNCAWFERMWVVQELGVANSATIIATGGRTILWSDILRCVCYLHYTLKAPVKNIRKLIGMEKIRQGFSDRKRQSLRDLIRECRHRRATDPRDKVFSLLGLVGDRMNPYLQPDYSKSVGEVYASATLHFITQYESLDPLCGWQALGREAEVPSWVPDYSLNQDAAPSPLVPIDGHDGIYHASGHDQRSKFSVVEVATSKSPWNKLCTVGLCIDSIDILSESTPGNGSFYNTERLWNAIILTAPVLSEKFTKDVKLALEDISSVVSRYGEFSSSLDPSFKASSTPDAISKPPETTEPFSAGTTSKSENPFNFPSSTPSPVLYDNYIVDAYFNTLLSCKKSVRERLEKEDISNILSFYSHTEIGDSNRDCDLMKTCKAFEAGTRRRRITITKDGYIGAVPEETQSGDLICVLFGCSVPVVLRKRSEAEYLFVGECYLHGFMDAEAIAMQVKGHLKAQDFVLT
jgi:hypothetical protein